MEKKGFKWQIFLAALLLLMQSAVLLMPWLQITGDRFVSVAMEINREAEQIAAGKAREAGAYEVTDNYERGTSMREAKAKEYQQKADEALHGRQDSIDGLHLAGWCLSSGADLAFEGIQVREGYSLRTSDIQMVLQIMGAMLFAPALMGLVVCSYMLLRRKTPRTLIFLDGAVTIGIGVAWLTVIPELLWEQMQSAVQSYEMVCEGVLAIPGVGEYSIRAVLWGFADSGYFIQILLGGLLILLSFAYFTVCRPERELVEIEEVHHGEYEPKEVQNWEVFPMAPMPQAVREADRPEKAAEKELAPELECFPMQYDGSGHIQGVRGQLSGQDFVMQPDAEVILGNSLELCDIVVTHSGISRRHCGVRYDSLIGQYRVIAYTSQPIKMSNGKILRTDSYTLARPGTMVYLLGDEEVIRLG